jgi:hypothetical protein
MLLVEQLLDQRRSGRASVWWPLAQSRIYSDLLTQKQVRYVASPTVNPFIFSAFRRTDDRSTQM